MTDFGVLHFNAGIHRNSVGSVMRQVSTISVGSISDINFEEDELFLDDAQAERYHRTSLPHAGFSARNEDWASVQRAIMALFHRKEIFGNQLKMLSDQVRYLSDTDIGPFIYDYYKNQLLRRGLQVYRDAILKEESTGSDLLSELGDNWDYFYREILPTVQVVLYSIQEKDLSIRQVTLLCFRDYVVLRLNLEDILKAQTCDIPPAIQQMLLVLQSVCECEPPSKPFTKLERLTAMVVSPFIGYSGFYNDGKEPTINIRRDQSVRRVLTFRGMSDLKDLAKPQSPWSPKNRVSLDLSVDRGEAVERLDPVRRTHRRIPSTPGEIYGLRTVEEKSGLTRTHSSSAPRPRVFGQSDASPDDDIDVPHVEKTSSDQRINRDSLDGSTPSDSSVSIRLESSTSPDFSGC